MIPLGHKQNDEISNVGIDTVTGLQATTGGVNASGNPVVPENHPKAQAAMRKNKTGPFKVVKGIIDSIKDKIEAVREEHPELQGSGSERYEAGDWTKTQGAGITDNVAPVTPVIVPKPTAIPVAPVVSPTTTATAQKSETAVETAPKVLVNAPSSPITATPAIETKPTT